MKKLYGTITAIFIFLIFAFFYNGNNQNTNKIPKVGILQLTSHPALDDIHRGIIDTLKDAGYENGKNIHIKTLNAQNDQSNLNTMSQQFVDQNSDVLVGIATPSALALKNVTSKTPIVLGAVTDPKGSDLVKDNNKPGNNITGVSDQAPIGKQFNLIKQVMPSIKKIGIIYTSSDPSATVQMNKFKKIAEKNGVQITLASISSLNDLTQVASTLVNKVEAIYVPTDNTVASGLNNIKDIATNAGVPVFPAAETMMKDGGLATIGLSQYKLGQEAGKMIVDILKDKKDPATTPIRFVTKGKLIINEEQAQKLKITIPDKLLQEAKKQGGLMK